MYMDSNYQYITENFTELLYLSPLILPMYIPGSSLFLSFICSLLPLLYSDNFLLSITFPFKSIISNVVLPVLEGKSSIKSEV